MGIGQQRVQQKIKTDVAQILQQEMSDPRMGFVTVTAVDLSGDFRHAVIKVSLLTDNPAEERRIMRMLEDARGYVQKIVASRLRTRATPEIKWKLDKGPEQSIKITSLLDEIAREREEREAAASGDELTDDASSADGVDTA
jgi:ribosome-binding factor A